MSKNEKIQIAKMNSLIERMDIHQSYRSAMINEQKIINESVKKERVQVTRDQILDILNQQPTGQFASITYVNGKNVYKTKKNWRPDDVSDVLSKYSEEGNEHWYNSLKQYNEPDTKGSNPLQAVISITRYTLNWSSPESYNKNYGEYSEKIKNLNMKYGLGTDSAGYLGDAHNVASKNDYGSLQNDKGELKTKQNIMTAKGKTKSVSYLIDAEGNFIGEIPNDVVASMKAKPNYNVAPKAAQQSLTPEALKAYTQERQEIEKDFRSQDFMLDKVLCIVATVDGTPYYYINDKVLLVLDKKTGVQINQQELVNKAEQMIDESFNAIDNFATEE